MDTRSQLGIAPAPGGRDVPFGGEPAPAPLRAAAPPPEPIQRARGLNLSQRRHWFICGASQSGKTYLLKWALRGLDNWVAIDTKRQDFSDLRVPTSSDPADILRHSRLIWQPPLECIHRPARDLSDPFSRGLWYLWHRAPVTIVVDELRMVLPTNPHPMLRQIVAQGMGKGVGVWGGTQLPSGIFPQAMHDAPAVTLFRLQSARGRGELAANLEMELPGSLGKLQRRKFYHWELGWDAPIGPLEVSDLVRR